MESSSTLPVERPGAQRGEAWFRRITSVGMLALIGAGLLGFLGPRETTVTRDGPAGRAEVTHSGTTRPGLGSEIEVTLAPTAPADTYQVRIDREVLATLGIEVVSPEPSAEIAEAEAVVYVFDAAPQDTVTLTWSGRVPTKQSPTRLSWQVTWVDADTTVPLTTWVLP